MYNSVQMTIYPPITFLQIGTMLGFTWSLERTTDEVYHPWGIHYHCEFLIILSSNFWSFDLRNSFQRVNNVVQLVHYNVYYRYRYLL